jgi:peptidoglycan hydrolase-like protein with peptidoglycan-binding domain
MTFLGRRSGATAALVVALLIGAVTWLATDSSKLSKPPGLSVSGSASVQRRSLVETDTDAGTVSYTNPRTVYAGTVGTFTLLPRVGRLLRPGRPVFDVDGAPVIVMSGSTPAYRDLVASDRDGRDVLQLNRNLVKLGLDPDRIVVDNTWQAATTAGVDAFQASVGETETGRLELGEIVFLPGDQIVSSVAATLGDTAGPGAPVLQTTSTHLIVTVDLPATSQGEAKVGERVTVEMPAGNVVNGVITAVSPVALNSASSGSGSSSDATIPVTVKLLGHVSGAGLDQAAVSVNFAQAVANHVLSVPVTALLATPGANYDVQETQPQHKLIPVTLGLFAAGYVQISGPGIHPGVRVTNSQG